VPKCPDDPESTILAAGARLRWSSQDRCRLDTAWARACRSNRLAELCVRLEGFARRRFSLVQNLALATASFLLLTGINAAIWLSPAPEHCCPSEAVDLT
jgi:hypothetical protein